MCYLNLIFKTLFPVFALIRLPFYVFMVKPLLSLFVCFYSFMADFGELSKKLAEVWKQLPEKDKLVSTLYYGHVFIALCLSKYIILL